MAALVWDVGPQFLNQGLNPCSLHWKERVLTTGPPGSPSFMYCYFKCPVPIERHVPLKCKELGSFSINSVQMVVKCTSSCRWYSSLDPIENFSCLDVEVVDSTVYKISCCYLVAKLYLTLATPWTVAHQAPLSMGFLRQEYCSGLPFPSPRDLPNPEIQPVFPVSPALLGRFFTTEPPGQSK